MKIKLLKDIVDNYYNVNLKAGTIISVKGEYMYGGAENGKDKLILVHGHGAYTYAKFGEYEIC